MKTSSTTTRCSPRLPKQRSGALARRPRTRPRSRRRRPRSRRRRRPRLPYLRGLNPQQLAAATAPFDAPLLIPAGAGSGKTLTLQKRIEHAVRWAPALAARGARGHLHAQRGGRARARACARASARTTCATFHKFCLDACRAHRPRELGTRCTRDFSLFSGARRPPRSRRRWRARRPPRRRRPGAAAAAAGGGGGGGDDCQARDRTAREARGSEGARRQIGRPRAAAGARLERFGAAGTRTCAWHTTRTSAPRSRRNHVRFRRPARDGRALPRGGRASSHPARASRCSSSTSSRTRAARSSACCTRSRARTAASRPSATTTSRSTASRAPTHNFELFHHESRARRRRRRGGRGGRRHRARAQLPLVGGDRRAASAAARLRTPPAAAASAARRAAGSAAAAAAAVRRAHGNHEPVPTRAPGERVRSVVCRTAAVEAAEIAARARALVASRRAERRRAILYRLHFVGARSRRTPPSRRATRRAAPSRARGRRRGGARAGRGARAHPRAHGGRGVVPARHAGLRARARGL